ncbi:D-sedoheptulose 7-phosphate isomerase [Desulfonatronum lacustre]|uniref:D-sedoheptulose 7-phosphate isomerase n=1 Tax=Desulfonatronum lacustre TaxID=66849 RepID=UPI0006855E1E|nr:D-sedoheptulose 7-phosphate isomerase [Desulfonatronum lacustre]
MNNDDVLRRDFERLETYVAEGDALREAFFSAQGEEVVRLAHVLAGALARGGKILLCGNGGSAADAQHLAAEFVNRFLIDRRPLPALALTTDTSILTAVGNDFGFDLVFAKQVQALGREGDVLLGLSTSGNSPNVVAALEAGRALGMITIGLTGEGGGAMRGLCDYLLAVPSRRTPLIQEIHITVGHLLCLVTDEILFGEG